MCVLPASHLKVQDSIEQDHAGEQKHLQIFVDLGGVYCILLLAAPIFSNCMGFPMSTLWPARQCCQGAEISAEKHKRTEKYFKGLGKSGAEILTN
jgi:hypothetical protein